MLLIHQILVIMLLLISGLSLASENLILTGSSTIAPLASELGRIFEQENPKIRVDVQTGGSTKGIVDTRKHLNDIGMVSRSLYKSESDLMPFELAKDGIAVIVHKSNPLAKLDKKQLQKIFTKEIVSWKELGIDISGNIVVVNKAAGRSTLELFLSYLGKSEKEIKADTIIGDNQQGIKAVMAAKNAIGYVSIGSALLEIEMGAQIKAIILDEIDPSIKNVKNGTYPIVRDLLLVTTKTLTDKQKSFLDFVRSKSASKVIESLSFVSAN